MQSSVIALIKRGNDEKKTCEIWILWASAAASAVPIRSEFLILVIPSSLAEFGTSMADDVA
ncbi:uncharacterized protein G2W53_012003 [Senna tora]|uniref:Uncharacterized protein n=1 Tax=Senna tora TaxID=362788 RepID=A0A834WN74_9FABA|nr:uncharacterized protein G2W53_012003 [Senna tora]